MLRSLALLLTLSSAAASQASDPARAPLRAGDRILIKVWVDTLFADTVRIDETGNAVIPRLGPTGVLGMASSAIADSIRRAYARVVRAQAIEVTPLRRITVLGEVHKPGTYFMETRASIREAVALAGGITEIGTLGRVTVMRDSTRLVFKDWQRRADDELLVRSGDVVWVDREAWLKRNIFSVISGIGVLVTVIYSVAR